MTWIMLIKKLPTQFSPPKLSIHWSEKWPMKQDKKEPTEHFDWGIDPNKKTARRIQWRGEAIRVFDHEYSVIKPENMHLYVFGTNDGDPSHELVVETIQDQEQMRTLVETDLKEAYDAALVDGAIPAMALEVIRGNFDGKDEMVTQFPPLGWYRCVPEYAELFCYEEEMTETMPDSFKFIKGKRVRVNEQHVIETSWGEFTMIQGMEGEISEVDTYKDTVDVWFDDVPEECLTVNICDLDIVE